MFKMLPSRDIQISKDERYIIVATSPTEIGIWKCYDTHLNLVGKVERVPNTVFKVVENDLFYVRSDYSLVCLHNFDIELSKTEAVANAQALYGYTSDGNPIVFKIPEKYKGKISEYSIKFDVVTNKVLLVLKLDNEKFYTFIAEKNGNVLFNTKKLKYLVNDLSLIEFYDSKIYVPATARVNTFSYETNEIREMLCLYVEKDSKLLFEGNYMIVVNKDRKYRVKLKKPSN